MESSPLFFFSPQKTFQCDCVNSEYYLLKTFAICTEFISVAKKCCFLFYFYFLPARNYSFSVRGNIKRDKANLIVLYSDK